MHRERSPLRDEYITPERLNQLKDAFRRARQHSRGGKNQRRRLKGLCCGLLRFLIHLCTEIIGAQPVNSSYFRRREQAEERLRQVLEENWLPRRDQPLLELAEEEELESEIGEVVDISSDEEEGATRSAEPSGASGAIVSSLAGVRVTSSNPLIRRASSSATLATSAAAADPIPYVSKPWGNLIRGVSVRPGDCQFRFHHSVVISVDWHQVLDVKRSSSRFAERPDPSYSLLDCYRWKLESLKRQGAVLIINSYTCSAWYKSCVHSVAERYPGLFDLIITTSKRTGVGGKLWTLCQLLDTSTCATIHIDDSSEILEEIGEYCQWVDPPLPEGSCIKGLGISVPKKPKTSFAPYFWNLEVALDAVSIEELQGQLPRLY